MISPNHEIFLYRLTDDDNQEYFAMNTWSGNVHGLTDQGRKSYNLKNDRSSAFSVDKVDRGSIQSLRTGRDFL